MMTELQSNKFVENCYFYNYMNKKYIISYEEYYHSLLNFAYSKFFI